MTGARRAAIAGSGCVVWALTGLMVGAPERVPATSIPATASGGAPVAPADPCPPLGVEQLLGRDGCREHQRQLEGLVVGGKTYTWAQYAAWGGELFRTGRVEHPPVGPAPSEQLSQIADYTCNRCHNDAREDPVLTRQDPAARFAYIQGPPARRALKMTQGTTFWGAVNRRTFYNDIYAPYRNLCVPLDSSYPDPSKLSCGPTKDGCGPGCRAMDAPLLADAVQVCGKYCSVGRYLTDWELASIVTFFWDLQVPLSEVDLRPAQRARVARILTDPRTPEHEKEAARRELAGSFLLAAGETRRDAPPPTPAATPASATDPALIRHLRQFGEPRGALMQAVRADRVVMSEEDPAYEPDTPARARGQKLYDLSCGHCHGPGPDGKAQIGGRGHRYLAGTRYLFYEVLENGTAQAANIPYMPEFPLERMSYRQASELLDYLRSLPPSGRLPATSQP